MLVRQRNLAAAYNNIGDVQRAQNELAGALGSYRSGLAIAQSLATSDPDNASVLRELLVTYIRIGDVQVAQKDLPGAMMTYRDGLAIAERLAASDPPMRACNSTLLPRTGVSPPSATALPNASPIS